MLQVCCIFRNIKLLSNHFLIKPVLHPWLLCQTFNSIKLYFVPYKIVLVVVKWNRVLRESEDWRRHINTFINCFCLLVWNRFLLLRLLSWCYFLGRRYSNTCMLRLVSNCLTDSSNTPYLWNCTLEKGNISINSAILAHLRMLTSGTFFNGLHLS